MFESPALQFKFDRLGPRVPAILVSPYIERGTIDSRCYDHTSILATLKKAFGLPKYLTRRDAAALTFEDNLRLSSPRSDTPKALPRKQSDITRGVFNYWPDRLNDFQQDTMRGLERLSRDGTAHPAVRAAAARLVARKDPL